MQKLPRTDLVPLELPVDIPENRVWAFEITREEVIAVVGGPRLEESDPSFVPGPVLTWALGTRDGSFKSVLDFHVTKGVLVVNCIPADSALAARILGFAEPA